MNARTASTMILALVALGAYPAAAQDQQAGSETAQTAPLWLISCSNELQPEQLLCEFSQSIVVSQGNQRQRAATASFNRAAGSTVTNAAFILPLGVRLPDPVTITVDGQAVGSLAWQSCDAGGCYALSPVNDAWLQSMRRGNELGAAFKAADGRDLSFSFQLSGFTKAEEMLP